MPATDYFVFYPHPVYPTELGFTATDDNNSTLATLLKDALKDRMNAVFASHFDPADYTFYQPNDLTIDPYTTLYERARQWLREHHEEPECKLLRTENVRDIFSEGVVSRNVHLLLVTSEILESLDDVGELGINSRKAIQQREEEANSTRRLLPAPSDGVKSEGVQKVVGNLNNHFHAGRPDDNYGPSVALFHPTLGLLAYHLRHIDRDIPMVEPSDYDYRTTHLFMVQALRSYETEELRVSAIRDSLKALLGRKLTWDERHSGIHPDAVFGGSPPFGILEVKNEVGLGGDASLQAGLRYARIVTNDTDKLVRRRLRRSNYPAILISSMGDLLEIEIAVYTDGPYTETIFSERLRLDSHRNENVVRIARAFKAVQFATDGLSKFYAKIDSQPHVDSVVAHLFPSPLPVPSYEDSVPSVTFTNRMSRAGEPYLMARSTEQRRSGIYIATLSKPSGADDAPNQEFEVVVKFTADYNAEAHRILADAGFAPVLHACVPVCDRLLMVVMDRVDGEMLWTYEHKSELVPHSVYADVKTAIERLHQHDLVFGDLRAPNILCVRTSGGAGSGDHWRAMLIDFDWVGTDGKSFYPAILNDQLPDWAPGMRRRGLMRKAHDLDMLKRVKKLCQPNPDA
ncbi:hypothetical protein DAEQUDRAFT_814425 [Daedalea quercina L-15889]|uniref:Protein kinase domain-containing protein n=1 Tax=Daedalea quercina L-15889 TaxID=1314783 RepID=A0A165M641_9APHY|nr:hypothetical protein DAEQUDRAFT_814425 [Daedalea quercina L-15889]